MTDAEPQLNVLALNSGSSSLKFGLYRVGPSRIERLLSGEAESIGDKSGKFHAEDSARKRVALRDAVPFPANGKQSSASEGFSSTAKMPVPAAIGHRIVHGGPKLRQHCLIDDSVLAQLEAATAFAPLHIPSALSVIRFAQEHFPGLPQAACFDTTFHAELPEVARVLPISKELQSEGIQRYGFHGLSCESIVHQLANDLPNRLDHRPSRQWRKRDRGQSRQIDRHQHGIDPNRRRDHGHAERRSRSGRSGLSDAREEIRCRHARRLGRSPFRPPGNFGHRQRHAAAA